MSRQFDEYMEDKFEIYGELFSLVEPESIEDLMEALKIKEKIQNQINSLMHDEDSSGWCTLLQQQEDYISEYVEFLGDFNNTILTNNIGYLLKKNNMRVGELEEFLGISTGYISRTIKEDSKKKMSIDIVWKIARLFGTDVRTLTENEMWISHSNTDLLKKFLEKLYKDTKDNYFRWEYEGGVMVVLNERFEKSGLITTEEDEKCVYHPQHLNPEVKWVLNKDIISLECFDKTRDLAIIPYIAEEKENLRGYDFILIWQDGEDVCWQKVFYTADDPFGHLLEGADKLYSLIEDAEFDAKLTPNIHQLISGYVEGGRPD